MIIYTSKFNNVKEHQGRHTDLIVVDKLDYNTVKSMIGKSI